MQKAADKGKAAVEVGSFEDGIGHYRTAIAVDPSHAVGYSSRLRVVGVFVCVWMHGPSILSAWHRQSSPYLSFINVHLCLDLKQTFNAPLLVEVARAYVKLKQHGPAKEAAEQALRMNEG